MNHVDQMYRNVLNPWQTTSEIRSQTKFLNRLVGGLTEEERNGLLRLGGPDREW